MNTNTQNSAETRYVFIGGSARTGTSMIRAILGSHPDVSFIQYDLPLWRQHYPQFRRHWQTVDNYYLANGLLDDIFSKDGEIECYDHKPQQQDVLAKIDWQTIAECPSFAHLAGIVFKAFFDCYQQRQGKTTVFGLKTPDNELFSEDIFLAFPDAKFIHMYRSDIAATVASQKRCNWHGEDDDMTLSGYTQQCCRSMDLLLDNFNRYGHQYMGINYNTFVKDPERYTQILSAFVGIPYTADMLAMNGHYRWQGSNSAFAVPIETAVSAQLATKPITNLAKHELALINDMIYLWEMRIKAVEPDFSLTHMESLQITMLGDRFIAAGVTEIAKLCYEQAISIDPQQQIAAIHLGEWHNLNGNYLQALKVFDSVLQADKRNRLAVGALISLFVQLGKPNDALTLCNNYLNEFKDDVEVTNVRDQIVDLINKNSA